MSNPNVDVEFNDLEFGRGELIVEYICWGKFIGRLVFNDDYQFRLTGTVNPGDPPTVSLDGFGDAKDSNGHHYQYFGCVMPLWPHDPRKRPTIVGSVIRAAPKQGSKDRPGGASAFIAIKQNPLPNPDEAKPADTTTTSAPPSGSPTVSTVGNGTPSVPSTPAGGASAGGAPPGPAPSPGAPGAAGGGAAAPAGAPGAAGGGAAGTDKPATNPSPAPGAGGFESETAYGRPFRG